MKILTPLRRLIGFSALGFHECPNCGSQEIRLSRMTQPQFYKLFRFAPTVVKIAMRHIFDGSYYPRTGSSMRRF